MGVAFKDEDEDVIRFRMEDVYYRIPWFSVRDRMSKDAVMKYAANAEVSYRCWKLIIMGYKMRSSGSAKPLRNLHERGVIPVRSHRVWKKAY